MIADCGDDHCVTCSDEARPMRVLAIAPGAVARCRDERGATHDVMVDLVDAAVGDVVLVHAGTAISAIENAERLR
jgi:hydrogenase expression/formation protein HypC